MLHLRVFEKSYQYLVKFHFGSFLKLQMPFFFNMCLATSGNLKVELSLLPSHSGPFVWTGKFMFHVVIFILGKVGNIEYRDSENGNIKKRQHWKKSWELRRKMVKLKISHFSNDAFKLVITGEEVFHFSNNASNPIITSNA